MNQYQYPSQERLQSARQELESLGSEQVYAQLKNWVQNDQQDLVFAILPEIIERFPQASVFQKLYQQRQAQLDHVAQIKAAKQAFPGPEYLEWLQWFHTHLQPRTYLEIGVESGKSLAYAQPPTYAIGIDPQPRIVHQQGTWVKIFTMPSDDFFYNYDLRHHFEHQPLDLALIDGLHTFDQALRDFVNVERYAHEGTLVLFHDIYPVTARTALRQRVTNFWLGDTWKVMLILRELRPDLRICTLPTYPSGLGVVSGLDPDNRTLPDQLPNIIAQWMPVTLESCQHQLSERLNTVENTQAGLATVHGAVME